MMHFSNNALDKYLTYLYSFLLGLDHLLLL